MTAGSGGHYSRHRRAFTQTVRLGRLSRAWFVATGRRCVGVCCCCRLNQMVCSHAPQPARKEAEKERQREEKEEDSLSHQLFLLFDPCTIYALTLGCYRSQDVCVGQWSSWSISEQGRCGRDQGWLTTGGIQHTHTARADRGGGGGCCAHGRAMEGGPSGVGNFIHTSPSPHIGSKGKSELYISRRQGGSYSLQ
jgi:hypothetical protein